MNRTLETFYKKMRRRQVEAVVRAVAIHPGEPVGLQGVLERLAQAERRSGFECGFVGLAQEAGEHEALRRALADGGYVEGDGRGALVLTGKGRELAHETLPGQIEVELERGLDQGSEGVT